MPDKQVIAPGNTSGEFLVLFHPFFEGLEGAATDDDPAKTILYCTDAGSAVVIEGILGHRQEPTQESAVATTGLRIAMLEARGHTLSLLPELATSLILITDQNKASIEWEQHCAATMMRSPNRQDYTQSVWDVDQPVPRRLLGTRSLTSSTIIDAVTAEASSLRRYHFLASEERYQLCRSTLLQKYTAGEIYMLQADIAHPDFGESIQQAQRVHNASVAFASFSTVGERRIGIDKLARYTRFDADCPIAYATQLSGETGEWDDRKAAQTVACLGIATYIRDSRLRHLFVPSEMHE